LLFCDPGIFPRKNPRIMSYRSRRLLKGVFLMTSLSLAECCRLLAIDPKTLRQWVVQAQMALHTDPTNAKIKCLQVEQVQSLAHLHGRVLKPEASASAVSLRTSEAQSQGLPTALPDTDLRARLAQLEVQVATLQTQLTDLSLQLLREREQRLLALEAQCTFAGEPLPPPSADSVSFEQAKPSIARRAPRQQTRLIPFIEYGARGQYVLICPKEGEQHILPDSSEWFAWLATLRSFRFIGRRGRLSTYRNPGRSCWMAYRRIHGHRYEYALGHTERLTIARLEQMAATLQSHVPTF
jgi:hypothetical protein